MMFKRIVSFLFAVIVATSSAFAWDAYSFTGVYDVASFDPPILYADSSDSDSGVYDLDFTSGIISNNTDVTLMATGTSNVVPGYDPVTTPFSAGQVRDIPISYFATTANHNYGSSSTSLSYATSHWQDVSYDSFLWTGFNLTYNISVPSNSAGFECDFSFLNLHLQQNRPVWGSDHDLTAKLYFDDTEIDSWDIKSNNFADNQFYAFSSSSPPSNIRFVFTASSFSDSAGVPDDSSSSGSLNCSIVLFWYKTSTFKYSFLSPDGALIANVGEAQDDINNHESIESQWTGSMSSNFDALDMDSFSFPSGLLSGFSLITGIFQDLWNGMGDYKILYVFPLFLGIALLLIGRISKFSGGQSSSRSNRGDDDA